VQAADYAKIATSRGGAVEPIGSRGRKSHDRFSMVATRRFRDAGPCGDSRGKGETFGNLTKTRSIGLRGASLHESRDCMNADYQSALGS